MNKTRKAFLNAGAIIAIVVACVFTMLGVICIVVSPFVTTDNLCEVYEKDTQNYAIHYVNEDKDQGIEYFVELKNGEETNTKIYVDDLEKLADITQTFLKCTGWGLIIFEVASFITAIFVIKDASKLNNRIASVITLLVLSLFTANLLTFAFMVVGLCLRNKLPPELTGEKEQKA